MEASSETSVTPPAKTIETQIIEEEAISKDSVATKAETKQRPESYEGKVIKSFKFNRHTYKVRHWEEVLIKLCDHFAVKHKDDFEKVLWISGEDKTYFSLYKDQLSIPEKIIKTDIYVETKLSPNEIVKTAKKLLAEFGNSTDKLIIAAE